MVRLKQLLVLVVACMSYPHMTAFGYISSTLDVCARAGASVASYLLQPKATISLGASGAVFGLFAVSVLVKLSFNLKKLIECGILGQFVIKQLLQVSAMIDCLTIIPVPCISMGACAS